MLYDLSNRGGRRQERGGRWLPPLNPKDGRRRFNGWIPGVALGASIVWWSTLGVELPPSTEVVAIEEAAPAVEKVVVVGSC
uniref:Uncharacterized protein n=1 Tax=Arundo donax TaxID=35708 RepID=A0A0A9DHR8_ARUDO